MPELQVTFYHVLQAGFPLMLQPHVRAFVICGLEADTTTYNHAEAFAHAYQDQPTRPINTCHQSRSHAHRLVAILG